MLNILLIKRNNYMNSLRVKLIAISGSLAVVSLVFLFKAAGTAYQNSAWILTSAHIDEAIPICTWRRYSRGLVLPFDCSEEQANLQRRYGTRGVLSFKTPAGKPLTYHYTDENIEAFDLKTGMDVAIKYNIRNPSEFELASALQRGGPAIFVFSLLSLLPGAGLLTYYLIARRLRQKVVQALPLRG